MSNSVNYKGITSSVLDGIKPIEISKGIFQYILWENDKKLSAIYKFDKNTKLDFVDSHTMYDEHIFVMSGVFNNGDKYYEEGSYIINPKGTVHIPQSTEGCTVLVTFP